MALYRNVSLRMHTDAKFRRLSAPPPNGRYLWIYLLTGPHTSPIPGIIPAGEASLAEGLGWTLEGFREAFGEVFREGMAKADFEARLVFLPNAIKHNPPASPNVIKNWATWWEVVPECSLKDEIYQHLKDYVKGMTKAFQEAFQQAFGEPVSVSGSGSGTVKTQGDDEQKKQKSEDKAKTNKITLPDDLGERFWFVQKGRKEDRFAIGETIEEMLRIGIPEAAIRDEIDDKKRDRSERLFELKVRLKRIHGGSFSSPESTGRTFTDEERLALHRKQMERIDKAWA